MTKIRQLAEKQAINEVNSFSLLDTLAQLEQLDKKNDVSRRANTFVRRGFFKHKTNEQVLKLVDTESDIKKSYWNSYHCTNILLQDGDRLTGKYCNNRFCFVCNRIRTAKLIKAYLPVIHDELKQPLFVTLTIPNVPGLSLKKTITEMIKSFQRINFYLRRQKQGIKGIRKIEVTYNERSNTYHPHFHFAVDGDQQANDLVTAWLNRYPEASPDAQDIRPIDAGAIIELFKYSAKVTTESDRPAPAEALNIIFTALRRIRTYQPISLNKIMPENEGKEETLTDVIEGLKGKIDVWDFISDLKNWINADGEILTEKIKRSLLD